MQLLKEGSFPEARPRAPARALVSAQAQTLFNNSIEGLCRAGVA